MMRVMVTGSAGFIGRNLTAYLANQAWVEKVLAVDKNPTNLAITGYEPIEQDITAAEGRLFEALCGDLRPDVVIHLAARPGVAMGESSPERTLHANVMGCMAVARAAGRFDGLRRVVFASSSTVYGDSVSEGGFSETDDLTSSRPLSLYGLSKRFGEDIFRQFHISGKMQELCILRLFSVIGPGLRDDLAPAIFRRRILEKEPIELFAGGEQLRDFTHVADVCRAIASAAKAPADAIDGQVINIGSGNPVRVADMLRFLGLQLQAEPIIDATPAARPFDMPRTMANRRKAKRLLRWEPELLWQDGIRDFVQAAR